MDDNIPDTVKKCLDILDENLEILSNIEFDLNDEKNDELVFVLSLILKHRSFTSLLLVFIS